MYYFKFWGKERKNDLDKVSIEIQSSQAKKDLNILAGYFTDNHHKILNNYSREKQQ